MDVNLTETQRLIKDSVRGYLENEVAWNRVLDMEKAEGFDRTLWDYLREAGWLGLVFPQDVGGQGGALTDLGVLLEELSRRASFVPFLETMASAETVRRKGDPAQARDIMRQVIEGKMILTPAVLEESDNFNDIKMELAADDTLTGRKYFVDYGQFATHYLVAAQQRGETALFLVDASHPSVQMYPVHHIGKTPQAVISYDQTPAVRVAGGDAYHYLVHLARALTALQCMAMSQMALDLTAEYAPQRVQFGRPIASFGAVQAHCANMAIMVAGMRFLTYEALWSIDHGTATDTQIAVAKAYTAKATPEVTTLANQVHGGIGFVLEYPLHLFSLQGKARSTAWGSERECLTSIADTIEEANKWL